jgi:hypothetical protein
MSTQTRSEERMKAAPRARAQQASELEPTPTGFRIPPPPKKCDQCGGQMRWCSHCEVWSRVCCVQYGTCQCS